MRILGCRFDRVKRFLKDECCIGLMDNILVDEDGNPGKPHVYTLFCMLDEASYSLLRNSTLLSLMPS
jgi:hypothetical protein